MMVFERDGHECILAVWNENWECTGCGPCESSLELAFTMKLILHTISLPLRHVFRTSHGRNTVQENLLVELRDGDLAGYGEGTSFSYYGATAAGMAADLDAARAEIESWSSLDPVELWHHALPLLGHNTFAQAALDEAAHDLHGKRLGQPTYKLWGLKLIDLPCSDYTLGIDELENTLAI